MEEIIVTLDLVEYCLKKFDSVSREEMIRDDPPPESHSYKAMAIQQARYAIELMSKL